MVALVAGPSTMETFAISAIGNGRVYLVKQSLLARAYHGFLGMQPVGLFLLPLDGVLVYCRVTLSAAHYSP